MSSPGRNGITIRALLRVAFGRWPVEACFREAKEELGMDHYEVRGWRCVHRHFYVTQLSHLFCAMVRKEMDNNPDATWPEVTMEQVRSAVNVWLNAADLPRRDRYRRYQEELDKQEYYQKRNAHARECHTKTRVARLLDIGIDPDKIKSCVPKHPPQ